MWVNIQKDFNKAFFNFSMWLTNNEDTLNISSQDFYKLSLDSQHIVINKYFESRGLTIGNNLHIADNKTPVFIKDNGNSFYDELRKMIRCTFEYINNSLVSHKV